MSPCKVSGIISYCAPTDMSLSEGNGPMEDLLGTDDMASCPDLAKSASCSTYLSDERSIPPILMFHGTEDELVSIEHGRRLYNKLAELDKDVEYYELINENHNTPTFWGDDVLNIVEKFIKRNTI